MPSMVSYVIGLAMLVLIGTGGYYLMTKQAAAPSDTVVAEGTAVDAGQAASLGKATSPAATTVVYTDKGFSPAQVTIKLGQKVRFFNQSKEKMWVASGPIPTHATLPEFDQNGSVGNGLAWEFAFTDVGTFEYYNQMNPKVPMGKVTVNK